MSKATVFFFIIIAVVVGAVLYSNSKPVPSSVVNMQGAVPAQQAPNASKTSVSSDASAIDAQMTSLDADTANISQSINDQPIDPTL